MDALKKIYDYALEEIMADRFGRYSKYIIQDRAIPDVRDGLKPVQRRILYAMYKDHNTHDKPYRKSAKTVGNVMGNFHPHGDSSIYDAMVRMSQWWKQGARYIDMHGNNGSMDGDPAAAMRYTEARLDKISLELLKEIEKDTIEMAPNFDDTLMEPTVLPAGFPNLLVNGSSGISAGYATNIPPHNLGEVISATVKRISKPDAPLSEIMKNIKGPDFPTGGIIEGIDDIKNAYKKGKARIIVKAKAEIIKGNKPQIIITEIPFDANKAGIVKKIEDIRLNKKIEGILEVRDETDKDGLQIAVDLKPGAKYQSILNYLYKNTDLQLNFNYNSVAICNRTPKQVGLIEILDYYIEFKREVLIRRTEFDLEFKKKRHHILEGLVRVMSILDEVIKLIRASKNKADAIKNLSEKYNFSYEQSEAIVNLQLYRLTNTDVLVLEEELQRLTKEIKALEALLKSDNLINKLMISELEAIKKQYATKRKTTIKDEVEDLKIDKAATIIKEDVTVGVTSDGYIKIANNRSFAQTEETEMKDTDYLIFIEKATTLDKLLIFTNLGNFALLEIDEIGVSSWKDLGKHVSNFVKLAAGEKIIKVLIHDEKTDKELVIATKKAFIKRTVLSEFNLSRKNFLSSYIRLRKADEVIDVNFLEKNIIVITANCYALVYDTLEIPQVGIKAAGVKAINLKNSHVVRAIPFGDFNDYLTIFTDRGTAKRMLLGSNFEHSSRALRGNLIIRRVKSAPHEIVNAFIIDKKEELVIRDKKDITIKPVDLPICDKEQVGKTVAKSIQEVFIPASLKEDEQQELSSENAN